MRFRFSGGACAALISALLALPAVRAGILLEVGGPTVNYDELGGPRGTNYEQALGVDFTLTVPLGGVLIRPLIENGSQSTEQLSAWLTTAFGPGTAPDDGSLIASAAIDLPAGYEGWVPLFAPLDLAPAHYFLILYGPADTTQLMWEVAEYTTVVQQAAGVIAGAPLMVTNAAAPPVNTLYPPASGFVFDTWIRAEKAQFEISQVPEPATGWMMALALVFALAVLSRPGSLAPGRSPTRGAVRALPRIGS
jgi:hypothetical protein